MKLSTVSISLFFICSVAMVCASETGSRTSSNEKGSVKFHSIALNSNESGSEKYDKPIPEYISCDDRNINKLYNSGTATNKDSSNSYWTCLEYISTCIRYCCDEQDDRVNGYNLYHDNP